MPAAATASARLVTRPLAFEARSVPREASSSVRLAFVLLLAAVGMAVIAGALLLATLSAPVPSLYGFRAFALLFALANAEVGVLIVRRQPRNAVGWLALAAGVVSGAFALMTEYAVVSLIAWPGAFP
ncbi:hypothetical protein BH18CHL2_BH18CHL2_10390 [soil metagenome]